MRSKLRWSIFFTAIAAVAPAQDDDPKKPPEVSSSILGGLKFRNIGPAMISGRISDFAVNPKNSAEYYVAVASGHVWKTTNAGTTWQPVFDGQPSYSIGVVVLDPKNPHTVWVGTGENNSQRSVGFGDGVYRSDDGGKSWKNMGLKKSEHIGRILIDPRNSQTIYVAAQGPLWSAGGDRGLYKSTDGGATWNATLKMPNEHTGVADAAMDPRDANILYAASYQRRRHTWTLINGGPGSGLHKSTDGGATWRQLKSGLPSGDLGKIGVAVSPVDPDVVYATIEAQGEAGGIFRSTDRGETWERRNPFIDTQMYYGEIFCDPADVDRIYVMATVPRVSTDGGKTLDRWLNNTVHVDCHAAWIDPDNPRHMLQGNDGGIYESHDRGQTWRYIQNLPVAQFYRVSVDNSTPFYYVYGGTQDNNTVGGPSRTTSANGIQNSDWFITIGGDGFKTQIDPTNPAIVYSQYQYGGLARFDRTTGELLDIRPIEGKGEPPLRWNWDAPLIISPHNPARLYFGANRLYRSDDRGESWTPMSGDLTRQLDRNQLPVMGKVWGVDAVAKNANTAIYGNISYVSESPLKEGLIYVGTDDGLVQVTEDGGKTWKKIETFPGVPERTYTSTVLASRHDLNTVYATFDNHKMGDFLPYVLKSTNKGASWTAIASDLPKTGMALIIVEDPVSKEMLFVGTEFGVFVTLNGGKKWIQLKSGLPAIPIRDIAIQERENDLVLASFGRGFYILDDYTPLRSLSDDLVKKEAHIFPVKDAFTYIERSPLGGDGKGSQGDAHFTADNPPLGATITYYLREEAKTKKKQRQDREKELEKAGKPVPYPTPEQLRAEDDEEAPAVFLVFADAAGNVVRRLKANNAAGVQRTTWDLKMPSTRPVSATSDGSGSGWFVVPGTYSVMVVLRQEGKERVLAGPVTFTAKPLQQPTIPASDPAALAAFREKAASLQRAIQAAGEVLRDARNRVKAMQAAMVQTAGNTSALHERSLQVEARLTAIQRAMSGDETISRRNENPPPTIEGRLDAVTSAFWSSTAGPTGTQLKAFDIASEAFAAELSKLKEVVQKELPAIEQELDALGAPHTPGRMPEWKKE
jgi:photosystem II stability/assembly factor-like uncharacterized protein